LLDSLLQETKIENEVEQLQQIIYVSSFSSHLFKS